MQKIDSGIVVIAHVRSRTHFVLVTGFSVDTHGAVTVLDPLYNSSVYNTSEIFSL